jgi:hypothetical protein
MKIHFASCIVTAILILLILYPLIMHFVFGWRRKADDIVLSLSLASAKTYLESFQNRITTVDTSIMEFTSFYNHWYGRKYLVVPIIIVICSAVIVSYSLVDAAALNLHRFSKETVQTDEYMDLPLVTIAALAGAYGFVAWEFIWRSSRRDLSPANILGGAVRIWIAVPLGYSLAALVKDDLGAFIAFSASAFPLKAVVTILQRIANKQLQMEIGASSSKDQVTELSCIDNVIADRLQDSDVTTVGQLAYCDPVQTCMRTNLSFVFISDLAAQALAWIYFGKKLDKLREVGLRGAVEIYNLRTNLDSDNEGEREVARAVLDRAAKIMPMTPKAFSNVMREISEDPYTKFLTDTWPN